MKCQYVLFKFGNGYDIFIIVGTLYDNIYLYVKFIIVFLMGNYILIITILWKILWFKGLKKKIIKTKTKGGLCAKFI